MRPIKKIETIKKYFPYIHLYSDINLTTLYYLGYLDYSLYSYYLKKYYKRIEKFYQTLQAKKVKKVKKVKKIRQSKNWDRMSDIMEIYKDEYPFLKPYDTPASKIYDYYRYNKLPYFKLLNDVPKLPDLQNKVKKYYVFAIMKVTNPSPSIEDFKKGDYVIKRFVWENKQSLTGREIVDKLLSPAKIGRYDNKYKANIEDILDNIFFYSERYEYVEFLGIKL